MKPYTYLLINLACISIPLVASFIKYFPFYREWKFFLPANIIVALAFLVWDYWFTGMGVWGFNPDYLSGIYLLNLPLEEILFFICIPYACVFTYYVIKKYVKNRFLRGINKYPLIILLVLATASTILFHDRLYTFFTALFLAISLLLVWFKKRNINYILLSYIIVVPFFFLSNGILTGSMIEEPIVWYDNTENLNIRMFTIPIEDTFYGMLLILLNVLVYEKLKTTSIKTEVLNKTALQ
jgi:lycopene cyclase domain-containing protein